MKIRKALSILLAVVPLSAAAQNMQPGDWQFTTTIGSSMIPKPQVATVTQCVTKAEADDPASFMGRDQSGECQITPGALAPGSYTWTIACPKRGVIGSGKASYGPDQMESDIRMTVTMPEGNQKMEITNRTVGRRLGPCATK